MEWSDTKQNRVIYLLAFGNATMKYIIEFTAQHITKLIKIQQKVNKNRRKYSKIGAHHIRKHQGKTKGEKMSEVKTHKIVPFRATLSEHQTH